MAQKHFERVYETDATTATDPPEQSKPTDEELLAADYENFPPDQFIRGAIDKPGQKAGDLVERDRQLRERRAELAKQQRFLVRHYRFSAYSLNWGL
jgi:hypothetical protein